MRWLMRRCINCKRYTLNQDKCPYCGGSLRVPHPPKFSPSDKYVEYRYKLKYNIRNQDNL
ncbi:MAG: RNA-protein complex protein Nop10 [Caldisphaera sp.]|jgi:H/ACA ribonucleoprotein complex subunit 3|uniref:RNA-protein complex protein Nop10 n=1 Tax=Caldisphaera sp. TaxID=2060322 RepID=UPI00397CF3BD